MLARAQMQEVPEWPVACLKALHDAPEEYLSKNGEAKLFSEKEIHLLETRYRWVIRRAVRKMKTAMEWFLKLESWRFCAKLTTKLIGQMEVRLGMFVHRFKADTRVAWDSIDAIGQQLAK